MAKKQQEELNKLYPLNFTKQELIIMFNVLVAQNYKLGDAALLWPAVRKIEAIVAVDTNIPEQPQEGGVILES